VETAELERLVVALKPLEQREQPIQAAAAAVVVLVATPQQVVMVVQELLFCVIHQFTQLAIQAAVLLIRPLPLEPIQSRLLQPELGM
jgi:hypothetical protein